MKKVVFRVDSSSQIGSGHLMRCLTLAKMLKEVEIMFISRNLSGNLNFLIEQAGYMFFCLPKGDDNNKLSGYENWLTVDKKIDAEQTSNILKHIDVDFLVVDSYALDEEWEQIQRPYVKRIMVIDDLANRRHDCDILLDQNYYQNMKTRYDNLVPQHCKRLLGPKYALLRDEFYEERKHLRTRDGSIHRILVFFGGSDLTNQTMKAVKSIAAVGRKDIAVDVVVGSSNKNKEEVERFCQQHKNIKYYCQVSNMAELMHKADLAIGAGGTTIWERCFLGLPSIVVSIADNQVRICEDAVILKCIYYLGKSQDVNCKKIQNAIGELMKNKKKFLDIVKGSLDCMADNIKCFE